MRKSLTAIVGVLALGASLHAQTPKFGRAGGIGSTSSGYPSPGAEPTGGTYNINGLTGVATFGGIVLPNPVYPSHPVTIQRIGGPFSPDEIGVRVANPGANVVTLENDDPAGYSAITFRGTFNYNPDPTKVTERMALGWSNAGLDFLELSTFDNTLDPGTAPPRFQIVQTGGVDPTGGVVIPCNTTAGSAALTCASAVPAAASGLYLEGFGVRDDTQIASGGGTATPTMTRTALSSLSSTGIRFSTPTYAQRPVMDFSRTGIVNFNNWYGGALTTWDRVTNYFGVNIASPASNLDVRGYGVFGYDGTNRARSGDIIAPVTVIDAGAPQVRLVRPNYGKLDVKIEGSTGSGVVNWYDGTYGRVAMSLPIDGSGGMVVRQHVRQLVGSTTSDTASLSDAFVIWNAIAAAPKAQTIPGCSFALLGFSLTIIDEANTAATYNIVVTPSSGQIGFGTSKAIAANGASLRLVCDGANNWVPF